MELITYEPEFINLCETCQHSTICEELSNSTDSWAYSEQFSICQAAEQPTPMSLDDIILRVCCAEGLMAIPLTPDEELALWEFGICSEVPGSLT